MPVKPLTYAELRGMLVEAGLTGLSVAEINELLAGINAGSQAALDALTQHYVDALGPNPSQQAIDKATRLAEAHARDQLLDQTAAQLNALGETISQGIADGLGPADIARNMQDLQGLDSNRIKHMSKYSDYLDSFDPPLSQAEWERRWEAEYQRQLRDRRLTIARTEQGRATEEANRVIAEENGAKFKAWITSGEGNVCPICQENEAAGWIPLDEEFPSGDQQPPAHPNDACTIAYRTEAPTADVLDSLDERVEATAEATGNDV